MEANPCTIKESVKTSFPSKVWTEKKYVTVLVKHDKNETSEADLELRI